MIKSIALAADPSRLASLLLSCIPAVCVFVARRQPRASTASVDRLGHSRALGHLRTLGRACRLVSLLLIAWSLSVPEHARAEGAARVSARELFQRGVKSVELGDLAGALAHFQEAYDQSPNQTVLFNIAQTQIALGRPVEGVQTLRRYVRLDRTPASNAQGRRVRELLAYTERRLGKITLEVRPEDAALEVDGVAQALDATGSVEVAAGSRQLVLTKPGFQTAVQRVDVAAGTTTSTTVELVPIPTPPAEPLAAPRRAPEVPSTGTYPPKPRLAPLPAVRPAPDTKAPRRRRILAIVTGVSGALLAGGGIAILIENHGKYRDYRRDHEAFSNDLASGKSGEAYPARAASLQTRAASIQRTDDIGTGMTVLGGVLLAATGTLLAWDF